MLAVNTAFDAKARTITRVPIHLSLGGPVIATVHYPHKYVILALQPAIEPCLQSFPRYNALRSQHCCIVISYLDTQALWSDCQVLIVDVSSTIHGTSLSILHEGPYLLMLHMKLTIDIISLT